MNFFNWLFRKQSKPALNDPVFGHIEFDSSHDIGLWSHLPATPRDPMILIEAPSVGPSQVQRDFYRSLHARLANLESESKQFIAKQDNPPANLAAMTVYAIEIGPEHEIASGAFVIELADEPADEIHRVEFVDSKPTFYGVDD